MDNNQPTEDTNTAQTLNNSTEVAADNDTNNAVNKSKKNKSSIFSHLKKKLSLNKKSKTVEESTVSPRHANNNENQDFKNEKRSSGIRLSFGKGKGNGPIKEEKEDYNKLKDSSRQINQARPHSVINPNVSPPRYGYLATFGWYWGPLSRAEATHYLRHTEDGSFLVRDSEGDPNKFTLSFKGASQIFHNRILRHGSKYAFLPDEEFDSLPELIEDATRRSKTSAYCFSRSTDSTAPVNKLNPQHQQSQQSTVETTVSNEPAVPAEGVSNNNNNNGHCKHEVRLLFPVSRYQNGVRSLAYLCRFMIRQYCGFCDLDKLQLSIEMLDYVKDQKFYL